MSKVYTHPADPGSMDETRSAAAAEGLRLHEGNCRVFFAFDVGYSIDLDAAQRTLAATPAKTTEEARRTGIPHRRRAPTYLQFRPAPLQIDQPATDLTTCEFAGFRVAPRVECTLYDFGAVSVAYRIPLEGNATGLPLEALLPLAESFGDNRVLQTDARRRVEELTLRLAGAIERPGVVDLVEDYTVYHASRWSPAAPAQAIVQANGDLIARLLLSESGPLSPQAVEVTLTAQLSYAPTDAAVIDWNAALLLDAQADDTLAVLEFANVELLEMRFIDDRLDTILERSSASLLKRDARTRFRSPLGLLLDPHRAERRRLAALQMENAVLFEGINNALKLVGDQHLARLYALAARRFHLADWDQSILRKLHTLDELHQKLVDEQSGRRMEILEWIVIVLIASEIVVPYFLKAAK